jgi:hypothetical protein
VLVLALAALLLAACDRTWIVTYDGARGPHGSEISHVVLTSQGTDTYEYESTGVEVEATALPTNTGGNLRTAFSPADAPSVTDSQSCATWTAQSSVGNTQQGAALRVSTDPAGATRALTVTKNVIYGATWIFNFHVWDSSMKPAGIQVGSVDMGSVVAGKPFPWHLCARTMGTSFEMKVWTGDEPEPAWGDTSHGKTVQVGDEWVYPGTAGWYIGHLPPGGFADFTDLKTWKYDVVDGQPAPVGPDPVTSDRVTITAAP